MPYKNSSMCKYCHNKPHGENPFAKENGRHLGKRYDEISRLADLEEMLVARVHPIISCWALLASGDYVYSVHCVNFRVNTHTWEDSPPRKIGVCRSFLLRRKKLIPKWKQSETCTSKPIYIE